MIKLMLATILSIGLLFSQSLSDLQNTAEKGFDKFSLVKQQINWLKSGEFGGVQLTQQQKEKMLVAIQVNLNSISVLLGSGGSVINPQVFVLLESLLRTDEGVVFYFKNKARSVQRVEDAMQLLRE